VRHIKPLIKCATSNSIGYGLFNLYLSKGGSDLDVGRVLRQIFMNLTQSLSDMKHKVVNNVRELAMGYLREHFVALEEKIQELRKDNLLGELVDELQDRRGSIERLVFSLIRSHAFTELTAVDDAQETLQSIQARITELVNGQQATVASTQKPKEMDEFTTHIEKLGFMQRAPTTEIPLSRLLFTKHVSELSPNYCVLAQKL
jgi:hypothetical protein